MEKTLEILKIQPLLKIPITDIVFQNEYVEIISQTVRVGSIPFYSVANILSYDTSFNIVNRLKWNEVYFHYQKDIDNAVKELLGIDEISITVSAFRSLIGRDNNGVIISGITCQYDGAWKAFKQV